MLMFLFLILIIGGIKTAADIRGVHGNQRPFRTIAPDGYIPHQSRVFFQRQERTAAQIFPLPERTQIRMGDLIRDFQIFSVIFIRLNQTFFKIRQLAFDFLLRRQRIRRSILHGKRTGFPVFHRDNHGVPF